MINVNQFADGRTDSTTSIQNAINYAGSRSLYFPSGRYIITRPLVLSAANSGMRILGEGISTQLYGVGVDGAVISLNQDVSQDQITNVSIRDVSIYGSTNPMSARNGIVLKNCAKCTVENVDFEGHFAQSSLLVSQCWNNNFRTLNFSGSAVIANVYIVRERLGQSSNANNFYGMMTSNGKAPVGALLRSESSAQLGRNNNFYGCTWQQKRNGVGIRFESGRANVVSGNYFEGEHAAHIRIGNTSAGSSVFGGSVSIDACSFQRGQYGIWLDQCYSVSINRPEFSQVDYPIVFNECSRTDYSGNFDLVYKDPACFRSHTGILCWDRDIPDGPPANPSKHEIRPPSMVMKSSGRNNEHWRMTITPSGKWHSEQVIPQNAKEVLIDEIAKNGI